MVEGFKNTEIGLIPNEWNDKPLGSISNSVASGKSKTQSDFRGKYFIYGSTGVIGQCIKPDYSGEKILVARVGANAGTVNQVSGEYSVSDNTLMVQLKRDVDYNYIFYFLKYSNLNKLIFGSGQPLITGTQLKNIIIPLPPTKAEQTAIATALNDADALIQKLEQLIAKKRNIKQGAMQKCLNPDFYDLGDDLDLTEDDTQKSQNQTNQKNHRSDKWEVKKLGKLCSKITTGKLDANAMKPDGEYRFYTCAKDYFLIDKYAFDDEALLISGNGENVGYVHYYKGKFNAYQRTYVLTGFTLNVHYIKKYLDKFLAARIEVEVNAGNTPYIRMGTLTEMDIYFPKEESEQTRIAQILTDIDNEIEALEKQLAKYKMMKQGMMQSLLTGKIRLNHDFRD